MRLYGYWRSSCSWRVRAALELKGIEYENLPVNLIKDGGEQHTDSYVAKNPMQQVPVLEFERDGKPIRLAQSLAILEYLEREHPEPALIPTEPLAAARVRQFAENINAGIQPLQNLNFMQRLGKAAPQLDVRGFSRGYIERGLAALEAAVNAAGASGQYLVGDTVTVADVCLVPQLYNARRFEIELQQFPTLLNVETHCNALPAFERAHPDQQPDAPRD